MFRTATLTASLLILASINLSSLQAAEKHHVAGAGSQGHAVRTFDQVHTVSPAVRTTTPVNNYHHHSHHSSSRNRYYGPTPIYVSPYSFGYSTYGYSPYGAYGYGYTSGAPVFVNARAFGFGW